MKKKQEYRNTAGFTLLEILLVVAAIAILAGIVIFALNPAKQLGDTRNAQRRVDVTTIANALQQYGIDHNSTYPITIPTSALEICKTDSIDCSGLVNLSFLTDNEKYLTAIPNDPLNSTANGTGYLIVKNSNNRIHVYSNNAENGAAEIDVER